MTARLMIGDVHDRLAEIPDDSVDLLVTSPPFLALRSYLPADHPDKHKEIGSEATPAAFIDTLLALTAEWRRILAPHGSICVELGDTYSGSGGAGGDYGDGGMRDGQPKADGSARRTRTNNLYNTENRYSDEWNKGNTAGKPITGVPMNGGPGWPLAKSLTGIPTLYPWSLAYGRNLLTGEPSPAGRWRIRNLIVWARMNPPVGSLGTRNIKKNTGDQRFRQATSYITVACVGSARYFDLEAVRIKTDTEDRPPYDWHSDMPDVDGDWLWELNARGFDGAHYATFPLALPSRLIQAMCPQRVCTVCGKPSERIVETAREVNGVIQKGGDWSTDRGWKQDRDPSNGQNTRTLVTTLGWSDCGHDDWRPGLVLDPFSGSGTTLAAAIGCGRDAIGIDIDDRNAALTRERCGLFVETETGAP